MDIDALICDVENRLVCSAHDSEPETSIRFAVNNNNRAAAAEWATILLGLYAIKDRKSTAGHVVELESSEKV
jgi:hypothetical protein